MTPTQQLRDVLESLRGRKSDLFQKFGVLNLAIFGSYVKKVQKAESDVDIFVELKPGYKTFDNYMDLKFCLEDLLQKKIDLAIKESIRAELKAEVLREAVYV
ncbi:nucleotidyltransferase family protein [candidate division KSB1 bacterium]|nr:nucleotidyltransferase family protein [candidate division KSB1 bacterium]